MCYALRYIFTQNHSTFINCVHAAFTCVIVYMPYEPTSLMPTAELRSKSKKFSDYEKKNFNDVDVLWYSGGLFQVTVTSRTTLAVTCTIFTAATKMDVREHQLTVM